jgi:hypothetical protein
MERFNLPQDIKVFCVPASSFPEGVLEAHQKLHSLVPYSEYRQFFGISHGNPDGNITYKAAAQEMAPHEAEKLGLEPFVIKKGIYTSKIIHNYMDNIPAIGETFQEMIQHPRMDPEGVCVEWYIGDKDVRCMVRLFDSC